MSKSLGLSGLSELKVKNWWKVAHSVQKQKRTGIFKNLRILKMNGLTIKFTHKTSQEQVYRIVRITRVKAI